MMDQILERCEGVIGIADDVVVHGKDDEEHDRRLHNLMRVAREHGLVFNREKCDMKTTSVTFFGTVYDKDGAHPDPKKVEAIHKMPPPEEPQELQKFLGMTTYLSPFHPFPLDVHRTPARTAAERFRVHLERFLPRSLRHCRADGLQGHHTLILRLMETNCHPG